MLKRTFTKKSKTKEDERPRRDDDIHITVYKSKNLELKKIKKLEAYEILMKGEASWLSFINVDNDLLWQITDPIPKWSPVVGDKMSDGSIVLPSDTDKRADIEPMIHKQWKDADNFKHQMEQQ